MAFLHEHIILPLSDLLKGENTYRYLRLVKESEQWTPEEMKHFQSVRLRKVIREAALFVPFYHDWFQTHNINPDTATLDQLPVVDKSLMRKEGIERFTNSHFPSNQRLVSRSSGSTGEPFTFYETKESYSVNMAVKLRSWQLAGYQLGDRYMKIANGNRVGKMKKLQDKINNCIYVPFYSMDEATLKDILDQIETTRPLYIRAYPAPLHLLAQYLKRHPLDYHHYPEHIFTTGATLTAAHRTEIENAFGCDIIDSYSCEGTPDTYETTAHDGYRVADYYGIIEVLDNDGKPITDGIGRVVSTDLWNLAHPFIRYDTQDLVEVHNGQILCIIGRESDTITSADGTIFTNHNFSHFFTHEINGVTSYQVVIHRDGSVTLRLVVNNSQTTINKPMIIDHWQRLLGTPVTVDIVDSIPLMHNNKRQTIIREP